MSAFCICRAFNSFSPFLLLVSTACVTTPLVSPKCFIETSSCLKSPQKCLREFQPPTPSRARHTGQVHMLEKIAKGRSNVNLLKCIFSLRQAQLLLKYFVLDVAPTFRLWLHQGARGMSRRTASLPWRFPRLSIYQSNVLYHLHGPFNGGHARAVLKGP